MKPARFRYYDPETVEEAVSLLVEFGSDARVLAGGQSLVPLMNFRLARPKYLVDINKVSSLDYIRQGDHTLAIGAMTRQRTVETSTLVQEKNPLLIEASRYIGHPTIRNRGTVGGSLAHADPAAEWPALVMVMDATLVLRGPQGERCIPAEDFFVTYLTTCLDPSEILVEIRIPELSRGTGWSFLELSRRFGDFALVGVAIRLTADGSGICTDSAIALTGVGAYPVRAQTAEQLLRGERLSEALFEHVARAVAKELEPDSDLHASADYRRTVARILTLRGLAIAQKRLSEAGDAV